MKQNVFIYFPGCISSRNMIPFEAQGCRFIFEVVFNHPSALKFLLCSESGLHRATGPVHPQNIYIWSIAHEVFLNCAECHRGVSFEEFKYTEIQKARKRGQRKADKLQKVDI